MAGYWASGLPEGTRIDPVSGVISGVPVKPGKFTIVVGWSERDASPEECVAAVDRVSLDEGDGGSR